MKVSIITVCYNSKSTITRCIESVINQGWDDYEYIVIDGGSQDGTLDILQNYSNNIDCLISEPDNGIYDAMNKGLVTAKGDWILFLNSDDRLCESCTLSMAAEYLVDKKVNYYGIAKITYSDNVLYSKPRNFKPIQFDKELPIHQTVFLSALYKENRFDTTYTVVADSLYLYNLSRMSRFAFIPVCVAYFSLGGASSWYDNFDKYKVHLFEHIDFLNKKNATQKKKVYTVAAFTFKYILSKFLTKNVYFYLVAYVAQLKARF